MIWPCDLPPKSAGAKNAKFHPPGLHKWVDVPKILSEPKFLGCKDNCCTRALTAYNCQF